MGNSQPNPATLRRSAPHWSSGLPFKLARTAALLGLLIGLVLGCFQVALDYQHESKQFNETVRNVLSAATPPSQRAAYELNTEIAIEVIEGLMRYDFVQSASIRDDLGGTLAETVRKSSEAETGWPVSAVLGLRTYTVDFVAPRSRAGSASVRIGELELTVNEAVAMQPLAARSAYVVLSGLVRGLLLAGILAAVFYYMVGRSLLQLAHQVEAIKPGTPERLPLPSGSRHDNDELGLVRAAINRLVDTINDRIGDLTVSTEALGQLHARFRDIADAASDWFWETDANGKFSYVSDRFASLTGIEEADILGTGPAEFGAGQDPSAGWDTFANCLQRAEPFRELRCELGIGSDDEAIFSISGVPSYDEANNWQGFRGAATDITREVESEFALRQAQKMQAIGQLTGGVAHDFNNLLAVIDLNLDMALDHDQMPPQMRRNLEQALAASARGAKLTQRLLAFSRSQPLLARAVDANMLITNLHELFLSSVGDKIQLQFELHDDLWECRADPSQLENVLLNVVINARDAMPDGGELSIRTRNFTLLDSRGALATELEQGEYISISIQDNGEGMSDEIRDRIFDPFFTTKSVGEGSGLGLSMAYGFAKQSGGSISVQTRIGGGTLITIYLPRTRAVSAPSEPTTDMSEPPAVTIDGDVLVVEDDDEVRQPLVLSLSESGYAVKNVREGTQALEVIHSSQPPKLLITDVALPGSTGGIALAELMLDHHPDARVLLISGFVSPSAARSVLANPRAGFLQKPFRRVELTAAVNALFDLDEDA